MKKLVLSTVFIAGLAFAGYAQEGVVKPALSKEQKAALKLEKEQQEQAAFVKAGFTEAEITQVKSISKELSEKSKEVKSDAQLSEDDKTAKLKAINTEKKERIIAVVGEARFKTWLQAKKDATAAKD